MSEIRASIIIVSWNVRNYIEKCLLSIRQNENKNYEIIVIDNASTDDTVDYLKVNWTNIKLIQNKKNLGFAQANNQGIRVSKGKYIILLNPDTKVVGNAIEQIVDFMDSHLDVYIAGGKLLNQDGTIQPSCRKFPHPIRDFLYVSGISYLIRITEKKFRLYKNKKNDKWHFIKGYLKGAFLIIRRDLFDFIDKFDEKYQLYFEEVDLFFRVIKRGFKVAYVPFTEVTHYEGKSAVKLGDIAHSLYLKSLLIYYKKFYSKVFVLYARFAIFFGAIFRIFTSILIERGKLRFNFNLLITIGKIALDKQRKQ